MIESLNKKYNTNYSKGDILIYNFESLDKVKDEIKYLFSNFIDVNKGFSKLSVVLHLDDNSERQGYVGITFDEDSKDSEINFSLYGDSQMDISNIENHIGAKLEPLKL